MWIMGLTTLIEQSQQNAQKILEKYVTRVQVNFVLIPGMRTKLTWIVVIKNFAIHRPSQPFLGSHLDFTTFSPWPSCVGLPDWATPFFYSLNGYFWIDLKWKAYLKKVQERENIYDCTREPRTCSPPIYVRMLTVVC